MFKPKKHNVYTITLKNGKKIKIWFLTDCLEKVLDDYNIPYTKKGVK